LLEAAQSLQGRVPIGFAGGVINSLPGMRSRIPGFFLGESVDAAVVVVDSLLSYPRSAPNAEPVPAGSCAALDHFRVRRALIEADLVEAAVASSLSVSQIENAGDELAVHIEAALALGDIFLLDSDGVDLRHSLTLHGLAEETLRGFLQTYSAAIAERLDVRGAPILAWLRGQAGG